MISRQTKSYTAGIIQAKAYRNLKKFMDTSLAPHNITMMDWAFLGTVYDAKKDGISVSDLAEVIGVEVSHITNMTIKLQARGLVGKVPHPEDHRVKLLLNTARGNQFVEMVESDLRKGFKSWLKPIGPPRLAVYLKTLVDISELDVKK